MRIYLWSANNQRLLEKRAVFKTKHLHAIAGFPFFLLPGQTGNWAHPALTGRFSGKAMTDF